MAFSDMNEVEQELGEEQPPQKGNNRTFLIIAGILGGIMVLALLCIAGLALFRYLPGQKASQSANETSAAESVNATNAFQASAQALFATQTVRAHPPTSTKPPTAMPTSTEAPTKTPRTPTKTPTKAPTNTPVIVLASTNTPIFDAGKATQNAQSTQNAQLTQGAKLTQGAQLTQGSQLTPTLKKSPTPLKPGTTSLPETGIAEELGTPGLLIAAVVLVMIIFLMRRLRAVS